MTPTDHLVTSHNFQLPHGTTATEAHLAGLNVPALIAGGHLAVVTPPAPTPPTTPGDGATPTE